MNQIKKILLLICLVCSWHILSAQIVDTTDIMKEFDEFSFRNARPVKPIQDSTKIREHLIGLKWGYGINTFTLSQDFNKKAMLSGKNYGIYYTYYHSLWNSIPLFGIETGVQFNEIGYTAIRYLDPPNTPNRRFEEGKDIFQTITIPFISQFRIDFWKMRLLLNIGGFASYKLSHSFSGLVSNDITKTYKDFGYGISGGGGLAFIFRPFEIHIEANYRYNLSNLYDKTSIYENIWVSTHTTQLLISAGMFIRIGGSRYKNSKK